MSGEKILFAPLINIWFALMFCNQSIFRFRRKWRCKMVASRQVEVPFYRSLGRHSGGGFRALAQVFERTEIPFLLKNVVSSAKHVKADFLKFAAPETAEAVSGKKVPGRLERMWNDELWGINWLMVVANKMEVYAYSRLAESSKKVGKTNHSAVKSPFLNFSKIVSIFFRCQTYAVVFGRFGGRILESDDVMSFHKQEFYPHTSFEANCVVLQFEMDRSYYVDLRQKLLVLKLMKLLLGLGYHIHNFRGSFQRKVEGAAVAAKTEEQAPNHSPNHVNNILHSFFQL